MKDETLVVITSALFIGSKGERLIKPPYYRLERLMKTLTAVEDLGFRNVVVLDNTLTPEFKYEGATFAPLDSRAMLLPKNEFRLNGPSRLETILLGQGLPYLQTRLVDFNYVLKLSAGYDVTNLPAILAKASAGLVFRMGNPFRTKIKFCLTSFYILPKAHFANLCTFFISSLNDMSNTKPLEYHLYRYVQQVPHRFLSAPYPVFDANFLSSGRSTTDFDYRLKEGVFKLIAKFGFYAYQFKG